MKRKRKFSKLPGIPTPTPAERDRDGGQCIFCFSIRYLYDRGSAQLDFENEVEGLIAALDANGYTGMSQISQQDLDAALLEHADLYAGEGEDERRRTSMIIAALERTWERAQS